MLRTGPGGEVGGELKTKTETEKVRGRGVSEKRHEDKLNTPGSKRVIDSKQGA